MEETVSNQKLVRAIMAENGVGPLSPPNLVVADDDFDNLPSIIPKTVLGI